MADPDTTRLIAQALERSRAIRRVTGPGPETLAYATVKDAVLLEDLVAALASAPDAARLTEALRRIKHLPYSVTGDAESDIQRCKEIARAALAAADGRDGTAEEQT